MDGIGQCFALIRKGGLKVIWRQNTFVMRHTLFVNPFLNHGHFSLESPTVDRRSIEHQSFAHCGNCDLFGADNNGVFTPFQLT